MQFLENQDTKNSVIIVLIFLTIISGFFLRGVFLTADPPANISTSGGIIADPGQYAYGARNKTLFNQWTFAGWEPYSFSPLIHYLNYLVYKFFGVSYVTHKSIPLAFSCLILLLLAWIVYKRFTPLTALFTCVFLAFSYPVILFSRFAIREYPMLLFLLASVYLFSEGARLKKSRYFFFSSIAFCLSFLSKGSGSYLLGLFLGIGLLWVVEKKIKLRQLSYFFGTFACFLMGWYVLVYLAHRPVIDALMKDNKKLRTLHSLPQVMKNVFHSQFLVSLPGEALALLIASLFILVYLFWKLTRKNDIPPFVELSAAWLGIGAIFHGVVSYRPTRFFVILLVPVAFLAGYLLDIAWNKKIIFPLNAKNSLLFYFALVLSLGAAVFFFILMGVLPYSHFLDATHPLLKFGFLLLIFLLFFMLLSFQENPNKLTPLFSKISKPVVILILFSSVIFNMTFFFKWISNREYQAVKISHLLDKALPPSHIAGNWASLLGTGTKHQTFFAWKNFFNWEKDFLSKNDIEYLLLVRGRFADEINDYRNRFSTEFNKAYLMAAFRMFNADVHLYSLKDNHPPGRLEAESFNRTYGHHTHQGEVSFDKNASGKMVLLLSPHSSGSATGNDKSPANEPVVTLSRTIPHNISIPIQDQEKAGDNYRIYLNAKGNFLLKVFVKRTGNNKETVAEKTLFFNSEDAFKSKELLSFSLPSEELLQTRIRLEISRLKTETSLDYIEIISSPARGGL